MYNLQAPQDVFEIAPTVMDTHMASTRHGLTENFEGSWNFWNCSRIDKNSYHFLVIYWLFVHNACYSTAKKYSRADKLDDLGEDMRQERQAQPNHFQTSDSNSYVMKCRPIIVKPYFTSNMCGDIIKHFLKNLLKTGEILASVHRKWEDVCPDISFYIKF